MVCATVWNVPVRVRFWIFTSSPSWAGSTDPDMRSRDPLRAWLCTWNEISEATFMVAIALVVAGVVVAFTSNWLVAVAAGNENA